MSLVRCPKCGHAASDDSIRCSFCGQVLKPEIVEAEEAERRARDRAEAEAERARRAEEQKEERKRSEDLHHIPDTRRHRLRRILVHGEP